MKKLFYFSAMAVLLSMQGCIVDNADTVMVPDIATAHKVQISRDIHQHRPRRSHCHRHDSNAADEYHY